MNDTKRERERKLNTKFRLKKMLNKREDFGRSFPRHRRLFVYLFAFETAVDCRRQRREDEDEDDQFTREGPTDGSDE